MRVKVRSKYIKLRFNLITYTLKRCRTAFFIKYCWPLWFGGLLQQSQELIAKLSSPVVDNRQNRQ